MMQVHRGSFVFAGKIDNEKRVASASLFRKPVRDENRDRSCGITASPQLLQ